MKIGDRERNEEGKRENRGISTNSIPVPHEMERTGT
jgi:hypothetical protein